MNRHKTLIYWLRSCVLADITWGCLHSPDITCLNPHTANWGCLTNMISHWSRKQSINSFHRNMSSDRSLNQCMDLLMFFCKEENMIKHEEHKTKSIHHKNVIHACTKRYSMNRPESFLFSLKKIHASTWKLLFSLKKIHASTWKLLFSLKKIHASTWKLLFSLKKIHASTWKLLFSLKRIFKHIY